MPSAFHRLVLFLLIWAGFPYSALSDSYEELEPEISPGYRPDESDTEGGIWMIFDEAEEKIKHSPNRLVDQELETYLKNIICELSPDFCPHIRIYIIRIPAFNATMAPNGVMQVWTGLLLRIRNEAQLAAVLGHELGHFLRRHSLKRFEDIKRKSTFLTFLSLGVGGATAAGKINPNVAGPAMDVTQLLTYASIFAYNRDQEREADKYGVQLMSNTHLNLDQAPLIWKNLLAEEAAGTDQQRASVFFATHPDPKERIGNLRRHAKEMASDNNMTLGDALNAERYWERVTPHIKMLLEDEINLHQFGRTEYLLQKLLDDDIHTGLVNYYMGELFRRRNNEEDIAKAKQYYLTSLEHENYPAETHRSLGLIYYKNGNQTAAERQFNKYLKMDPRAQDREMIEFYITSLSGGQ